MAEGTGGEIVAEFQEVIKHWGRMLDSHKHGESIAFEASVPADAFKDAKLVEEIVMAWAAEHPEPVYPTWGEWLLKQGFVELKDGQFIKRTENEYVYEYKTVAILTDKAAVSIPSEIAEKFGIKPKESI